MHGGSQVLHVSFPKLNPQTHDLGGVGLGDGREAQQEGDVCVLRAGSLCYTAERNTTL